MGISPNSSETPPIGVSADLDHVPAVDVQRATEFRQPGVHRLRVVDRQPGDLDGEAMMMLARADHHDDVVPVLVVDQQHRELQTGQRRARPVREIEQGGRRQAQRHHPLAGDELLERDRRVVGRDRDAVNGDLAARLARPGVQRGLQVDVLKARE